MVLYGNFDPWIDFESESMLKYRVDVFYWNLRIETSEIVNRRSTSEPFDNFKRVSSASKGYDKFKVLRKKIDKINDLFVISTC